MKSTFSSRIAAPLIVLISGTIILIVAKNLFGETIVDQPGLILLYAVIGFFWCWILFGEIRLRAIRVVLEFDRIIVRYFLGLGRERIFYYSELDGYETRILPAEHNQFEYLFIKKDGKRVIRLSQFYHRNYAELKKEIQRRLKGRENLPFSWWQELKDIFG